MMATCASCGDPGLPHGEPLPPPTDFMLTGAKIFTADEAQPWAEALVVREGRIVYVGDDAGALALQEGGAAHHDLDGKLVIPGLVDAHTHPGMIGFLGEDDEESPIPKTSHEDILTWLEDYAGWFWPPMILAGVGLRRVVLAARDPGGRLADDALRDQWATQGGTGPRGSLAPGHPL